MSVSTRLRIRHHMLLTKGGELTEAERFWLQHLSDLLGLNNIKGAANVQR